MNFFILAWLAACSCAEGPDPVAASLATWPDDPEALAAACEGQPFEELTITCRVQAAATFARRADSGRAQAQCDRIPEGTWRQECHFRAGEELGKAGRTVAALNHCAQAGWFGRNCLTHTGWNLPRDPALGPTVAPTRVEQAGLELLGEVDQALAGAGDGLEGEGRDIVMARFGYNLYVGSGNADPAVARLGDPLGAALRTGWGIETARLMEAPNVEVMLAVWSGADPPPAGPPLAEGARMGRYALPIQSPHEQGLPHLPIYGGGLRLVGETADEDALIASLEGLYWVSSTPADVFVPWVEDPRARVRATAAKLVRLTESDDIDVPGLLERWAASHEDDNVRWHADDGLKHRPDGP